MYGQVTGSVGIGLLFTKKDDKYSKENYRPITVLPCVDKVFEQLVGTQLTAGFDSHMYEYSSAYRKVHSCEKTLIDLVSGGMEKGERQ